jgi:hypothetical protein
VQALLTRLVQRASHGAAAALAELGERPASLLLAMLALNALASPYAGVIHDSQMYAVQVLHRLEAPAYDDDLFFCYGSQDQYSVFSPAVEPLAALLGLSAAFFFLYLAGKALLFLAMLRLVRRLLPDGGPLATLVLLFLAAHGLPYGAFGVFSVNEPFLTPRLFAAALVLLGLERTLAGRFPAALGLVLGGVALHPVMAAPALPIVLLWWARERLPDRAFWLLFLAGCLGAAALLACEPLAARVFGRMDADWLSAVRHASPYASPPEWPGPDLLASLVPVLVLLGAAGAARRCRPQVARLALLVVLVAAGGLGAAAVGSTTGYTLLLQGQFYRALWLATFLQMPLGFWLAARLWPRGEAARLAALTLLGWLLLTRYETDLLLFAWPLPVAVLFLRGLGREPRTAGWLWKSYAAGLAFAGLAGAALKAWVIVSWRATLLTGADGLDYARILLGTPGPALWVVLAAGALTALHGLLGLGAAFRRRAAAFGLAVQLAAFLAPALPYYQEHYRNDNRDVELVSRYLDVAGAREGRLPTLYWCNTNLNTVWVDLHAKNYFHLDQVQGLLFSRETAREARRRAVVVGTFEMERRRQARGFYPEGWTLLLQDFHACRLDDASAGLADLERLCREEAVDFAVLPQAFDGLYAATNGRIYVYDCRRLRRQFAQAGAPERGYEPRPKSRRAMWAAFQPQAP